MRNSIDHAVVKRIEKMKKSKYTTHLDGRDEKGRFIQPYNPETGETGERIYFSQHNYGKTQEGVKGSLNQKEFSETEPDIWKGYLEKINPEIDKLEKSINYNVFFCHALDEIEEDPTNKGYFIMFDTVPGLKWKDGDYYISKSRFLGFGKAKLTKISKQEALMYIGGKFCTTDDPFKLAKDRKVKGVYNKILNL